MKKKGAHFSVTSKERRGNPERMIRKYIKKTKRSHIIDEVKDRRYFKTNAEKRKQKRERAERMRKKQERRRIRMQERRRRKK